MHQSSPEDSVVDDRSSTASSLEDFERRSEVILRWDPHGKFLRFNKGNQLVQHLMVNYSKAKRAFENRDSGFESILEPHQTLTITGTESDEKTLRRSRFEAIDFLADIDREVRYIPDYGWIYPSMGRVDQENMISHYVDRVKWFHDRMEARSLSHVELIPLAKGLRREHYVQAADVFEDIGVDRIGMYGVQTPSLKKFVRRTESAIDVFDPGGILVIGKQSPPDVGQLPMRVDGVAGFWNWTQACNLTKDGYSSEELAKWHYKVKQKLRNGRTNRQVGLNTVLQKEVRTDGRGR
ncbi:hypothetical protein [Halorubellus sp. PRR65]|uniref:hypothetical protein n=1 Tax=Halorubellus sp. PRR65 TaxID=3098148 RepID=UPI002B258059|nr:hypothetical protein [Halorubellus sp. PRR65]